MIRWYFRGHVPGFRGGSARAAQRVLAGLGVAALFLVVTASPAQQTFTPVAGEVNKKMVKLFGAGGFKGLPSYGTGILVSNDGYILTVNNHILGTADLR